jgi:hypothetical protein
LIDAINKTGNDHEFLLIYLTYDSRYEKFSLRPVNAFTATIPFRSLLTMKWTVTVVCVPSPDDHHGGRSKNVGTNIREVDYTNIRALEQLIARALGFLIRGKKKELILRIQNHAMTTN